MRKQFLSFSTLLILTLYSTLALKTKEKGLPFPFDFIDGQKDGKCCVDSSTLDVQGVGQLSVRADIIKIGIEVSTVNEKSATEALEANNIKVNNIINLLTEYEKNGGLGLSVDQISTISFSVNPVYSFSENGEATLIGFKATQIIEIVVDEIELAGKIIDSIAAYVPILYVNFELSDEVVAENKEILIRNAINDAKSKAKVAVRQTDYKLTGIKTLNIRDSQGVVTQNKLDKVSSSADLIGNSQIISVTVDVTYNIKKNEQRVEIKNKIKGKQY